MTFTGAISSVLSQYATFRGRAGRAEYWWFYLFTLLLGFVTGTLDALLDSVVGVSGLSPLTSLALLIPTIAVTVRRLHDSNLSGWWFFAPLALSVAGAGALFFGFLTLLASAFGGTSADGSGAPALLAVGALLTLAAFVTWLVLMLRPSTPGPNRFDGGAGTPFALPPVVGGRHLAPYSGTASPTDPNQVPPPPRYTGGAPYNGAVLKD